MKKSVKVILICAASVLIAYAAIWSIYVVIRYQPFVKVLEGQNYLEEDRYAYYVKRPTFPSFTGNLTISDNRKTTLDEGDDIYSYLIIWPRFWGGYGVAANVGKTTVDYDNRHSHTDAYGIMLDENRKPDYSVPNVYDSIGEGIDKLAENCDAYAELMSRESGKSSMLKYGEQIVDSSDVNPSGEGREEFVSYAIKDIMEYLENN